MHAFVLPTGMIFGLGMALFHGCQTPAKAPPPAKVVSAVEQQIARGATAYAQHCADCHGASGQGTRDAPALVGKGALPRRPGDGAARQTEFRTALDVATFVTQNMPPDEEARQAISEPEYWALLAFALSANGVPLRQPVSPQNAAAIVLHP